MPVQFDKAYYLGQKLEKLQTNHPDEFGSDYTVADLEALFLNEYNLTPEEHYNQYSFQEELNPSADFDQVKYLENKLAILQTNNPDEWAGKTAEDVKDAFMNAGLSPLEHYNQYGEGEGVEAPAVDDGGGETSSLTAALNEMAAANEARAEFLEGVYEGNEAVAEEAGADPELDDTDTAIGTVFDDSLTNADNDGVNDLLTVTGSVSADRSDSYNQTIIDEQKSVLAKAVSDAQEAVDETTGLNSAVQSLATAQEGLGDAIEAQSEAEVDLLGAVAGFNAADNGEDDVTVQYGVVTDGVYNDTGAAPTPDGTTGDVDATDLQEDDVVVGGGTAGVVVVNDKGELELTTEFAGEPKAAELLEAVQADIAAIQALDAATSDLNSAIAEVLVLEGNDEITAAADTVTDTSDAPNAPADVTFEGLFVKDGVTYYGAGADNEAVDMYSVTDISVVYAADGSVTTTVEIDTTDGADETGVDTTATDSAFTLVDGDNPLNFTSADADASEFVDASSADSGFLKIDSGTTTFLEGVAPDSAAMIEALNEQSAFEEAVQNYLDAKAVADELEGFNDAVTEASEAITNSEEDGGLDITLREGSEGFTVDSDVYLYSEEESDGVSLAKFGANGEDKIYFGEGFSLVEIVAGDDITDNVGDVASSEIFWEQNGSNLTLYVEQETFAGNASSDADVTTITLTGVSADDVTFQDGYLIAGEVA